MRLLVFLLVFFFNFLTNAQCVDSIHRQSNYPCVMQNYQPVCGCNNVTYNNSCVAEIRNGVTRYKPGPCESMDFYFYPTLVTEGAYLNMFVALKTKGNAQLFIMDLYGNFWVRQNFYNVDLIENRQIQTENLPRGMYFIIVRTPDGYAKLKRFEKHS